MTGTDAVFGRARHRSLLEDALSALMRFQLIHGPELAAEDLRIAGRALGQITGLIANDEILDVVFREFCIGK